MPFLSQRKIFLLDIDQPKEAFATQPFRKRHLKSGLAMRSTTNSGKLSSCYQIAILSYLIRDQGVILQSGKIQFVGKHHLSSALCSFRPEGTDDVFISFQSLVRNPVWGNQAVYTEISVVREFAKVSAVTEYRATIWRFAPFHGVVAPLPNEGATEALMFINELLIILCVSWAVPHSVDVLA